jgi:outer membrane receptor for ferrienterochelin and colicins
VNRILASIILSSAGFANAQEALEQIVVTGTRSEHSAWESPIATQTIVITDESMQHYKNVAELLSFSPGLDMANGIRGQVVRLDGLDAKYTLILIDGQRVAGKIGDAYDLRGIELDGIQRIEIIRGAGSALYGSDAIGGVINIITRDSVKQRVKIHADTNGQKDLSLSSGVKFDALSLAIDAFGSKSKALQLPGAEASTFSASEKYGVQVSPRYSGPTWDVKSRLHASNEVLDATEVSAAGAILQRRNELEAYSVAVEPSKTFADQSQLRATLKQDQNKDDYTQNVRRTGAILLREKTDETNLETSVHYAKPIAKHLLSIGGQHIDENLSSDRLAQNSVDRQRISVYLQDEYDLAGDGKLVLVPAIRQDQDTQFENHTSGKLALRYAPDDFQSFLLSYGEGYRAPSFKELYLLFENNSVGYVVEGNNELTPESSRSIHAQYNFRSGEGWTTSLSAYHNRIQDLIENILIEQDASGIQHYSYENISAAETTGGDLTFLTELSKDWSLNLGYGFLQARDLSTQTNLPGRSKHNLSYQIRYSHNEFIIAHQLKWQSSRELNAKADLGNDEALVTGDLSLSYRQDQTWLYSIAVENIGGSAGDSYWRLPPRSLGFALTWTPKS